MGQESGRADARDGTLERLLLASAGGDEQAFAQLYDALAPQAYGLVRGMVPDLDDAADVTGTAFIEVWRRAGEFDPARSSARAWVLATVHLVAVRRRRADLLEEEVAASPAPATRPRHRGLSPDDRDALHLAYLGGCTEAEVSALMSTSPETTRRLITDSLVAHSRESR